MSDRLNEAIEWVHEAIEWVHEVRVTSTHLGPHTKEQMRVVEVAARAYADLVNGERVEPDFEAAWRKSSEQQIALGVQPTMGPDHARAVVQAAVGDRLLIDPPKEEE